MQRDPDQDRGEAVFGGIALMRRNVMTNRRFVWICVISLCLLILAAVILLVSIES